MLQNYFVDQYNYVNKVDEFVYLNFLHAGKFFMLLLSSADFFKINFFKKFFQERYQSVKQFVGPDLGTNCMQRLSAGNKRITKVTDK